jgi:hypothetical protein
MRSGEQVDLAGKVYGRWLVLDKPPETRMSQRYWYCRCECGVEKLVRQSHLQSGASQSCRCLANEKAAARLDVYGTQRDPTTKKLHTIFHAMRRRCNNPNCARYKNYGGRGILIDERFSDFGKFLAWARAYPYREGLTLDRVDVNGPYSPDNCQWLPQHLQMRNQTRTVLDEDTVSTILTYIKYSGLSKAAIARLVGVDPRNVYSLRDSWLDVAPLPI